MSDVEIFDFEFESINNKSNINNFEKRKRGKSLLQLYQLGCNFIIEDDYISFKRVYLEYKKQRDEADNKEDYPEAGFLITKALYSPSACRINIKNTNRLIKSHKVPHDIDISKLSPLI